MLALAIIFYIFMCFISDWDFLWPLTMIQKGGLGDILLTIGWVICLIIGLCK